MCFLRRPQKLTKPSPPIWQLLHNVKLTVNILSIFVAFLENMNFTVKLQTVDWTIQFLTTDTCYYVRVSTYKGYWILNLYGGATNWNLLLLATLQFFNTKHENVSWNWKFEKSQNNDLFISPKRKNIILEMASLKILYYSY